MRSHLFLAAARPEGDYRIVTQLPDGRVAIHAHQDAEVPDGVEVIRDGRVATWQWDDLTATHPALALALLGDPPEPPHYWTDDDPPSPAPSE